MDANLQKYFAEVRQYYAETADHLFSKCPAETRLSLSMLLCDVSEEDKCHNAGELALYKHNLERMQRARFTSISREETERRIKHGEDFIRGVLKDKPKADFLIAGIFRQENRTDPDF